VNTVKKIGVLGAGVMGSGIAQVTATAGYETVCYDVDAGAVATSKCGKNPVVIRDTPMAWGFVANRVYFAMVAEAQKVVNEGIASAEHVDQMMMDCFRWPTGPFGMAQGASSGWG
jgi:3-hydroxyacyl-CoA dehydrogenase